MQEPIPEGKAATGAAGAAGAACLFLLPQPRTSTLLKFPKGNVPSSKGIPRQVTTHVHVKCVFSDPRPVYSGTSLFVL